MVQASDTNHDVYDTLKIILIPIKISGDKILERQRNFIITKHFYSIKIIFKKPGSLLKKY